MGATSYLRVRQQDQLKQAEPYLAMPMMPGRLTKNGSQVECDGHLRRRNRSRPAHVHGGNGHRDHLRRLGNVETRTEAAEPESAPTSNATTRGRQVKTISAGGGLNEAQDTGSQVTYDAFGNAVATGWATVQLQGHDRAGRVMWTWTPRDRPPDMRAMSRCTFELKRYDGVIGPPASPHASIDDDFVKGKVDGSEATARTLTTNTTSSVAPSSDRAAD